MRAPALLILSLALATAFAVRPGRAAEDPAADATPVAKRTLLRGPDCLEPAAARDWQYVDSDQLVVDAGRRKYRMHLAGACTELGSAKKLKFRGDAVSGRICGNVGERIEFGIASCRIDRVELIDAETYRAATERRSGSVTTSESVK
ncbi:DUF6491 family protein [Arenimonas sp. MALMAid1274]|uniref:DUF6491 family protein n=1 Tax=Arenimonas sp. MALMAid1274 TaxID=3411630 RepID=UPI003B9EEFA6